MFFYKTLKTAKFIKLILKIKVKEKETLNTQMPAKQMTKHQSPVLQYFEMNKEISFLIYFHLK